jgi:hypothetical protein
MGWLIQVQDIIFMTNRDGSGMIFMHHDLIGEKNGWTGSYKTF